MQNESSQQNSKIGSGHEMTIESVEESSSSSESSGDDDDSDMENHGPTRGSFWDNNSSSFNTPAESKTRRRQEQERQQQAQQPQTRQGNATPNTSDTKRQSSFAFMVGDNSDKQPPSVFSPPNPTASSNATPPVVSTENERQLLLLMLLAQVCALHDPTPRTFTVHVLELFERGILDRESIRFLFDYGLVPSLPPSTTATTTTTTTNISSPTAQQYSNNNDTETTTAPQDPTGPVQESQAVVPYRSAGADDFNHALRRSQEASAIRSHLAHHHSMPSFTTSEKPSSPTSLERTNTSSSPRSASWAAEHFPLSLSRYQREFSEIKLLASGSFGQVFCATRHMDGRNYAVKKVMFSATGYSNDSVTQVVREVHCLAQCDHVHCVRYYTSWLEPSWMTGQNTASMATIQQQEQQLLLDMERVALESSDKKDQASRPKRPQRRFSFDNNGCRSEDEIFSYYNSDDDSDYSEWTCDMSSLNHGGRHVRDDFSDWGHPHDDSMVGRRTKNKHTKRNKNPSPRKQPQKQPTYKYQICLYIQMELCSSTTLADWIHLRNARNPSVAERAEKAISIYRQVCDGIAHVHAKSVLHRDLKPANIFRSLDDGVEHFKIGDFGLSKLLCTASKGKDFAWDDTTGASTRSPARNAPVPTDTQSLAIVAREPAHVPPPPLYDQRLDPKKQRHAQEDDPLLLTAGVGTASYAAPEQIASRSYGPEADIFSMGLVLLELFCCFGTQHERLHTFQDCRNGKLPPWLHEQYPGVASTVLACCSPSPKSRPSAQQLLKSDLWQLSEKGSSNAGDAGNRSVNRNDKHVQQDNVIQGLRRQLDEKEVELQNQRLVIAEKDCIIDDLRRQVEQLTAINNDNISGRFGPGNTTYVRESKLDKAISSSSDDDDY